MLFGPGNCDTYAPYKKVRSLPTSGIKSRSTIRLKPVCVLFIFQVGQAADEVLTHQLIDFLMGEADGIPKVKQNHTPQ